MTTTSYTTDPPLFTATITPTNSNTSLGPIALGTIPNDMLVEIQVTGLLDLYYSTSMHWYNADPALDLRGDYKSAFDAGGYYDYNTYCSGYVWVTFKKPEGGYQGGVSFCDETEPAFKVYKDTYTELSVARGAGSAYWQRGPNGTWSTICGGTNPPCWTLQGSFSLTVKRVVADLSLTANATTVEPGTAVTFTAAINPSSVTNQNGLYQVPYSNVRWSWEDSTGTTALGCSSLTCSYAIARSGMMKLEVLVNGEEQTQSVGVLAVQPADSCPPQDPSNPTEYDPRLADSAFVQGLLSQLQLAWNNSYVERGGDVGVNQNGEYMIREIPPLTASTCSYVADPSQAAAFPPGYSADSAQWHLHPYKPLKTHKGCVDPSRNIAANQSVKALLGPSEVDWQSAYLTHRTGYMMDGNGDLWRWNFPPATPTTYDPHFKRFRRQGNSACYVRVP
jgi:hypothetical protein